MLRRAQLTAASLTLVALSVAAGGEDDHRSLRVFARLVPTEEVPALSSVASARFKATIDRNNQTISYELSYEGLEAPPTQAHIHIGQRRANGGVSVFLCATPPTPAPAGTQVCPPAPATITGVLTPANIIGPAAQGIAPTAGDVNEFDELVDMIRNGVTYANVHSQKFPGGEVRGQVLIDPRRH